ncbi:DNA-binding transcriptional MerR regulator [Nakamurella sp. UYEF19]|uniref:MerR family transcriptional regulator n=1 Tax=Nakamurella sp. UYEF19 TaxID=1756392 RepID=UPI003399F9FB
MRMAELSQTSGTTVATIKYYLREGLLHSGERTSATQSQYDESHVRRLGLIRALIDIGGLSVARTAEVLAAMDDPAVSPNYLLGTSQQSVTAVAADRAGPLDRQLGLAQIDDLIVKHGWSVSVDNPGRHIAADVLATFRALGRTDAALIDSWAAAAQVAAEGDLEAVARDRDRPAMVETVVVGTVLGDVMLMALRRLAQESISTKQYPTEPGFVDDCDRVSL